MHILKLHLRMLLVIVSQILKWKSLGFHSGHYKWRRTAAISAHNVQVSTFIIVSRQHLLLVLWIKERTLELMLRLDNSPVLSCLVFSLSWLSLLYFSFNRSLLSYFSFGYRWLVSLVSWLLMHDRFILRNPRFRQDRNNLLSTQELINK